MRDLHQESAFLAVVSLSDAMAALAMFAKEGPALPLWPFGGTDVLRTLVEGLIRAAEIEQAGFREHGNSFEDEVQTIGQLIVALAKFCSDWDGAPLEEDV